ncbi:uncharacterized protein SAPINGB_P004159 [Magnusiomyces paraingens]|uniref:Cell wall mannoprotein 1 n=1 Tax=Magnusiomyces paraingens TaxID=2606893 RepID=A0A5E8C0H7_9ASCO|nr:uncharacterized protein SAPINGB_P004159 [Saprochaete ingens]VVT54605.1 unnamed protein product [Saprochaete ingens]
MVSKTLFTAAVVAAVGANAQLDGIISSIAAQISNGLVSGRKDGVPESQAASEVGEILSVINRNSDVQNLFSEAGGLVLGGINSNGVISFASAAQASLAALQGSEDGKTLEALISSHGSDLDGPKAYTIITNNLSPVLNLVIPQISSLSAGDQNVASAVNQLTDAAKGVVAKYGLDGSSAAPATSAVSSVSETASVVVSSSTIVSSSVVAVSSSVAESSIASGSVSPSVVSSVSTVVSTASAASSAATASDSGAVVTTTHTASATTHTSSASHSASSSVPQVNGQGQNTVQIIALGGAAAALFLL